MLPGWTAVIVNYNGAGYIEACVAALSSTSGPPNDIIVLDNASSDDSLQELHAFPRVNVLAQPRNLGFAAGANIALAAVETEFALLLNPDVEVARNFGSSLGAVFDDDPRAGVIGSLLIYPDERTIQHAGGVIERPLMTTRHVGYGSTDLGAFTATSTVDFVTGGAMALRMKAFHEIGGFDEQFSPVYYEDVDLCLRLRASGWSVRFDPRLRAVHHEGVTLQRSTAYFQHIHRNRVRFALKHLNAAEWRDAFAPAEYTRLHHELRMSRDSDWVERSGFGAIESILRGDGTPTQWPLSSLDTNSPPGLLQSHAEGLRETWEVTGTPLRSRIPLVARFRNWVNNAGSRAYVDEALTRQREFNASVVRAIEAQDQLNRSQTASMFLLAIDVIGRMHQFESETTDPRPS